MHFVFAAPTDDSSVADILVPVVLVALVVVVAFAVAAARRARSRRGHAQTESTGRGLWEGAISDWDLNWLFPEANSTSWGRSLVRAALTSDAVPVSLELDPDGLRLRLTGRGTRHRTRNLWSAPWADVAAAVTVKAGFKTIAGKMAVFPMTDVLVTVVGPSAQDFLWWWALDEADEEDRNPTPEQLAEDAEWVKEARLDLGPEWTPGTALLRVRMSAADGLSQAIARWARGRLPEAHT
jgi:hypothetical protein